MVKFIFFSLQTLTQGLLLPSAVMELTCPLPPPPKRNQPSITGSDPHTEMVLRCVCPVHVCFCCLSGPRKNCVLFVSSEVILNWIPRLQHNRSYYKSKTLTLCQLSQMGKLSPLLTVSHAIKYIIKVTNLLR